MAASYEREKNRRPIIGATHDLDIAMSTENDARVWLRSNGYAAVADQIDAIMESWSARGVATRRNWWDVLAGTEAGKPRVIEGINFPILAVARRRKGWPSVAGEIGNADSEDLAPAPVAQGRWEGAQRKNVRAKAGARSRSRPLKPIVKTPPTRKASAKKRGPLEEESGKSEQLNLTIKRFAQLQNVVIPLCDLVVLVGPQATGKSLALEIMKLAIDRNRIVRSLKQHGFKWEKPEEFSALYFGGGFENSWSSETEILYGDKAITLADTAKARAYEGEDNVFYIPAHRTLAIAEGWPKSFVAYQPETPYVVRRFSEELLTALNKGLVGKGHIFPHDRRLKDAFKKLIDEAVFHGATLKLVTIGMRKQFVLEYETDGARLPYMAWTAGQREFTPLLLGLYHLLQAGGGPKKKEVVWAIIEEPEMGLHPKAIVAVMAAVLDLLARGYKVALSTHSPTVLEVVWGMSRLKDVQGGPALLCEMMGLPDRAIETAAKALKKTYAVVHAQHDQNGRVLSKDISALDAGSSDPREWGWGGITGFSARVADVVARTRAVK